MSKFLSYILNLRGVAIFIVVAVHAIGNLHEWDGHVPAFDFLATFFDAREGVGTTMFIFIGGFLFQYITHDNWNFKRYIEKKVLFVILPYVLVSIPIIAYRIMTGFDFALPPGFNEQSVFYRFLYYIVTGLHLAPFWFISAIVLFYVSAPLFHVLDNRTAYRYIFPIIFITCFFTYRSEHNANTLLSYVHYFPVYYLGMWTSYHREKILRKAWMVYPLIALYVGISVANLTGWFPLPERISFEEVWRQGLILFNIDMLKAILLCFIFMYVLYRYQHKRFIFLEVLGEYSFGIFFVHCILIYGSKRIWAEFFGPMSFSLVTFIIYFALILIASIAVVYFIKRMTGRYSRNLIGS